MINTNSGHPSWHGDTTARGGERWHLPTGKATTGIVLSCIGIGLALLLWVAAVAINPS